MQYINLRSQNKLPNHYLYYIQDDKKPNDPMFADKTNYITKNKNQFKTLLHIIQDKFYIYDECLFYTSFLIKP